MQLSLLLAHIFASLQFSENQILLRLMSHQKWAAVIYQKVYGSKMGRNYKARRERGMLVFTLKKADDRKPQSTVLENISGH